MESILYCDRWWRVLGYVICLNLPANFHMAGKLGEYHSVWSNCSYVQMRFKLDS